MHKSRSHVLVLSALLAMSLGGCASLGKKPAEGLRTHKAVVGKKGFGEEEDAKKVQGVSCLNFGETEFAQAQEKYGHRVVGVRIFDEEEGVDFEEDLEDRIFFRAEDMENKIPVFALERLEWEDWPELARRERQFDKAARSEYRQWTDKELVHHVEVRGPPNNPFFYLSRTTPDGTKTILYDADGDGRPDRRIEKRPEAKVYAVERDSDGDGVFDKRTTYHRPHSCRVFEKRRPDGSWKKIQERIEYISVRHVDSFW